MNWMMKNSSGEPDAMFTLAVSSWVVVTALLFLSIFSGNVRFGDVSFTVSSVDATLLLGYLGACVTSYVVRRNKKDSLVQTMPEYVVEFDDEDEEEE